MEEQKFRDYQGQAEDTVDSDIEERPVQEENDELWLGQEGPVVELTPPPSLRCLLLLSLQVGQRSMTGNQKVVSGDYRARCSFSILSP